MVEKNGIDHIKEFSKWAKIPIEENWESYELERKEIIPIPPPIELPKNVIATFCSTNYGGTIGAIETVEVPRDFLAITLIDGDSADPSNIIWYVPDEKIVFKKL